MENAVLNYLNGTVRDLSTHVQYTEWLIKYGAEYHHSFDTYHLRQRPNFIKGCEVSTWICHTLTSDHKVSFYADSDAFISRGMAAILCNCLSGLSPNQILEYRFKDFSQITAPLASTKKQGFQVMLNHMLNIAKHVDRPLVLK